jgi:hypothetical protein
MAQPSPILLERKMMAARNKTNRIRVAREVAELHKDVIYRHAYQGVKHRYDMVRVILTYRLMQATHPRAATSAAMRKVGVS